MNEAPSRPCDPRMTPQSPLTFSTSLRFENGPLPDDTPKTYVLATENAPSPFFQFGERIKQDKSWHYHEIDTGHYVMSEKPEWTVSLLNSLT